MVNASLLLQILSDEPIMKSCVMMNESSWCQVDAGCDCGMDTCYSMSQYEKCFSCLCGDIQEVARYSIFTGGGATVLILIIFLIHLIITCILRFKNKKLKW